MATKATIKPKGYSLYHNPPSSFWSKHMAFSRVHKFALLPIWAKYSLAVALVALTVTAHAQESETVRIGVNIQLGNTGFSIKYHAEKTNVYHPDKQSYKADVENLLKSPPMSMDTESYVTTNSSREYGLQGTVGLEKFEVEPPVTYRPHEDPTVVKHFNSFQSMEDGSGFLDDLFKPGGDNLGGGYSGSGGGGCTSGKVLVSPSIEIGGSCFGLGSESQL